MDKNLKKEALKMRGIAGMLAALALAMPWGASSAVYAEGENELNIPEFVQKWEEAYHNFKDEDERKQFVVATKEVFESGEFGSTLTEELVNFLESQESDVLLLEVESPEVDEVSAATETAEAPAGEEPEPEEPAEEEPDAGEPAVGDGDATLPGDGGEQRPTTGVGASGLGGVGVE